MRLRVLIKAQYVFGIVASVALIGAGWVLWQGANQSNDPDAYFGTDKQGETQESRGDAADDPPPQFGVVTDVMDALTIVVDNSHRIRYLGVSAPVTADRVECFGKEAARANESMLGKTVRLEEDPVLLRAQDGAWVRYVWVPEDEITQEAYKRALSGEAVIGLTMPLNEDSAASEPIELGTSMDGNNNDQTEEKEREESQPTVSERFDAKTDNGKDSAESNGEVAGDGREAIDGTDAVAGEESGNVANGDNIKEYLVSERMIEMGLGFPLLSKEMKYYEKLSAAARYSSATKRGLWGKCEIEQDDNGLLKTQTDEQCAIKGVKILNGDKVYRLASCSAYADTMVLLYKDGEWLCSEEEATGKGYIKGIDCE